MTGEVTNSDEDGGSVISRRSRRIVSEQRRSFDLQRVLCWFTGFHAWRGRSVSGRGGALTAASHRDPVCVEMSRIKTDDPEDKWRDNEAPVELIQLNKPQCNERKEF
ncbi:hypothetical protein FQA47_015105 [Oryzias melastigma]|uniref:Uncharacterized protein n=1 Tax=Oryzias melastigma TaxID=30732 RepID=A0A834F5L0_ORYME|nr:hypothetical protein FQA47_015105 [Oryzias melastigma]